MDYTNITDNNKKILIIAHHVAKKHNSFFVGTEHYLLALLEKEGSLAAKCNRILNAIMLKIQPYLKSIIQ